MALEKAWGRGRRRILRRWWPGYVQRVMALRQGNCPQCPHEIIDSRDLKFLRNVCGYWFRVEDDPYTWRGLLGLARVGLCEVLLCTGAGAALFLALGIAWSLGLATWLFLAASAALFLVWFQLVYFFRDPSRAIPTNQGALVSPADGTVVDITVVEASEFSGGKALRIGIFLSVFNVHVNRMPCRASVREVRYFPGRFVTALRADAAAVNEQLWIDADALDHGCQLRIKQISGILARRIVCWARPGDDFARGERFGMIKFGSRTELWIPAGIGFDLRVQVGDHVRGGASILGYAPITATDQAPASAAALV